jgi:hypothetical protein
MLYAVLLLILIAVVAFVGINVYFSSRDRRYEQSLMDDEIDWNNRS